MNWWVSDSNSAMVKEMAEIEGNKQTNKQNPSCFLTWIFQNRTIDTGKICSVCCCYPSPRWYK